VFSRRAGGEGYVIADAVKVEYDSPAAAPEAPEGEEAAPPESSEGEESRVSESSAPESRSGQDVVREAKKWIGVRYKLGGQTRRGVDCSGLTMMVFKRFGVSLPHWDDKQYRMGKKVAKGKEKPGDLVFFNEHGRGISHVGIYSGNGNIVHASDYFGKVTESKMKYIKGYAGARRLPTDGRAASRSADEQSEGQDESRSAPETEASPPAETPTSTDRVSPPSDSAPGEAANEQPAQAENPEPQTREKAQPARQPRPREAQEKAAPSKAKKVPSKSDEREE
jgi:hypothetical protein